MATLEQYSQDATNMLTFAIFVAGVAMAMVGRLDQGKRVSIGLALAGAVGVGAAIYLCCRHGSEKKVGWEKQNHHLSYGMEL